MIWSPVNFSKYRPEIDQYLVSKEKKFFVLQKKVLSHCTVIWMVRYLPTNQNF